MQELIITCDLCGKTNPPYIWCGKPLGIGHVDLCKDCVATMLRASKEAWVKAGGNPDKFSVPELDDQNS